MNAPSLTNTPMTLLNTTAATAPVDTVVETFAVPALSGTLAEAFDNPESLVVLGDKVLHPRAERAAVLGEAMIAVMVLEQQPVDRDYVLELVADFYGAATVDADVTARVCFFDAVDLDIDAIVALVDPRTPSQQRLLSEMVEFVANKRETAAHLRRAIARALFGRTRRAA